MSVYVPCLQWIVQTKNDFLLMEEEHILRILWKFAINSWIQCFEIEATEIDKFQI